MDDKQLLSGILSSKEKELIENNNLHRFKVTPYFCSISGSGRDDPLRRQFVPDERELNVLPYETADPLCEEKYKAGKRIIKRYHDRVLFLVTAKCAMYCRHCFRRYYAGSEASDADIADVEELCALIEGDAGIKEVLLSGGDPLTLSDKKIAFIIKSLRNVRDDLVIRIGTRIPVVQPERISDDLLSVLSENLPLAVFTQFNHYRELTSESRNVLGRMIRHGIPVFNQTVLLKGINDDEDVLEKLFHNLVSAGVKPYYLFQGDLAAGTSHFRVPLKRGLEIMENLSLKMSGLSLPVFAVDLPGGGGKVRLFSTSVLSEEDGFLKIKNCEGKEYFYPDEQ